MLPLFSSKPETTLHQALLSASTPGKTLPSTNSRLAPPPVETWLTCFSSPAFAIAAAESPPPITVTAPFLVASASDFAISNVPFAKLGISNTPIGPFQNIVFEPEIICLNISIDFAPISTPVFPAGILQSPYFDLYADDALNYGGIGMVIGHEITHSFDDRGAQYDKFGNLTNWWTKADYEKFKERTQQVIDQYNSFTVLDSIPVNGALTVGENTADIAGVAIAYDAFKLTEQGKDTTKLDGFTPDQRFFLSIARIWRVKTTDEFLRMYVNTNPHSPAKWRVNGPLMNFTPFYTAFNVQPGDKMYKPENERIKVW